MSEQGLTVRHHGAVCALTLARPHKRNALDLPLLQALLGALRTLPDSCRVVRLAGLGPSFCAGADLSWMQAEGGSDLATNQAGSQCLAEVFAAFSQLDQAVLVVAHGPVRGGGCGLLAIADVVLADAAASFAFSELRLGLIPAVIAPHVARRLGWARAQTLFLTAETFDAALAQAVGLVDEVLPAEALMARADTVAHALAAGAPQARGALKRLLRQLAEAPVAHHAELAAHALAQVRAGAEAQEGLAAFAAKRPPRWRDQGAP